MKPEELRIGNWVNYIGVILKITSINSPKPLKDQRYSDKWIVELSDGSLLSVPLNEIKPIPLTTEWLEKFGFVSDYFIQPSGDEIHGYILYADTEIVSWIDGIVTVSHSMYKDNIACGIESYEVPEPINHVHSLQNLYFALTGTELIIKP